MPWNAWKGREEGIDLRALEPGMVRVERRITFAKEEHARRFAEVRSQGDRVECLPWFILRWNEEGDLIEASSWNDTVGRSIDCFSKD